MMPPLPRLTGDGEEVVAMVVVVGMVVDWAVGQEEKAVEVEEEDKVVDKVVAED
jgi:hypothetical protein